MMGGTEPFSRATDAAEQYALHAALVSVPLLIAAAAVYFFLRGRPRTGCIVAAILAVHPYWTVAPSRFDSGAAYQTASTLWLVVALVVFAGSLFSVYRRGMNFPKRRPVRFSLTWLLLAVAYTAVLFALAQPLVAAQIPPRISIAWTIALTLIGLAVCPPKSKRLGRPAVALPRGST